MRKKRYEEAFMDGYKPAVAASPTSPFYEKLIENGYPYAPFSEEKEAKIFFHTEEQRNHYMKRMKEMEWDSFEANCFVGITLGFPEKSVKYFSEMDDYSKRHRKNHVDDRKQSVIVTWAGISFASYLDFLDHEIKWLWDTYKHPKSIGHVLYIRTIDVGSLEVPYGDYKQLEEVRKYLMQKRGLVPAINS